MTLKDLGIPTLEELERMTDEEIETYFHKFLEVCRPRPELPRTAPPTPRPTLSKVGRPKKLKLGPRDKETLVQKLLLIASNDGHRNE